MFLHDIAIVALIIVTDTALSGDNALVIGAVAARLPSNTRSRALALGGGLAIVLRIALTLGAAVFLTVPLVKAIGGLIVFVLAFQLIQDVTSASEEDANTNWRRHLRGRTLMRAILAITVADLSMSLDNILAIAALANGAILLLLLGLLISIILLLVASAYRAKLIARFPCCSTSLA